MTDATFATTSSTAAIVGPEFIDLVKATLRRIPRLVRVALVVVGILLPGAGLLLGDASGNDFLANVGIFVPWLALGVWRVVAQPYVPLYPSEIPRRWVYSVGAFHCLSAGVRTTHLYLAGVAVQRLVTGDEPLGFWAFASVYVWAWSAWTLRHSYFHRRGTALLTFAFGLCAGGTLGKILALPVAAILVVLIAAAFVILLIFVTAEAIGRRFPGSLAFWPAFLSMWGWLRRRRRQRRSLADGAEDGTVPQ